MARVERTRFAATMALLRGLVILIAGVFAVFWPVSALTAIVVVGGALMIVDGILSLAGQNYGGERGWPFWLALARGIIAVLAGILVLTSPYLVTLIAVSALSTLCGLGAIVVGLIEAFIIIRNRDQHSTFWAPLAAAGLYVVLGLVLVFMPMAGAILVVQIGGAVLIVLGLVLLMQAWMDVRTAPGAGSHA
jgi:uncharacterized membrane protein HdeD (DUF308 family)